MPVPRTATRPPRSAVSTVRVSPYEKIKQAVLNGELAGGQPLVEATLAEWCGVSRTPVREALRRLEQDGLIIRDARGLAVRERSPEEILDIYDTRIVLESAAGRAAAERRNNHDIRALRWSLAECQAISGESEGAVAANERFHTAVWHATHNESLVDLLERLCLHLARYPETTLAAPGRWTAALIEHAALLDAIERRDGDVAAEISSTHFSAARDIRLELFAQAALHIS